MHQLFLHPYRTAHCLALVFNYHASLRFFIRNITFIEATRFDYIAIAISLCGGKKKRCETLTRNITQTISQKCTRLEKRKKKEEKKSGTKKWHCSLAYSIHRKSIKEGSMFHALFRQYFRICIWEIRFLPLETREVADCWVI